MEYSLENQQNVLNGQLEEEHSQTKGLFARTVEIVTSVGKDQTLDSKKNVKTSKCKIFGAYNIALGKSDDESI